MATVAGAGSGSGYGKVLLRLSMVRKMTTMRGPMRAQFGRKPRHRHSTPSARTLCRKEFVRSQRRREYVL